MRPSCSRLPGSSFEVEVETYHSFEIRPDSPGLMIDGQLTLGIHALFFSFVGSLGLLGVGFTLSDVFSFPPEEETLRSARNAGMVLSLDRHLLMSVLSSFLFGRLLLLCS
jgi:hypothetical protein